MSISSTSHNINFTPSGPQDHPLAVREVNSESDVERNAFRNEKKTFNLFIQTIAPFELQCFARCYKEGTLSRCNVVNVKIGNYVFNNRFKGLKEGWFKNLDRGAKSWLSAQISQINENNIVSLSDSTKVLNNKEIRKRNARQETSLEAVEGKLLRAFDFAQNERFISSNPLRVLAHDKTDPANLQQFNYTDDVVHVETYLSVRPLVYSMNKQVELHTAAAESFGRKDKMEDRYVFCPLHFSGRGESLMIGVFDGHGGSDLAAALANRLPGLLERKVGEIPSAQWSTLAFFNIVKTVFLEFSPNQRSWYEKLLHAFFGGEIPLTAHSTATIAIPFENYLWVACVGDTRAVLVKKGKAINLSIDAKINSARDASKYYLEETIKRGSTGCVAVWSMLGVSSSYLVKNNKVGPNMTRAVGYDELDSGINPRSKVIRMPLEEALGGVLMIATDGFWDCFSSQEAAEMVQHGLDSEWCLNNIAKACVLAAYKRNSGDNITVTLSYIKEKNNL